MTAGRSSSTPTQLTVTRYLNPYLSLSFYSFLLSLFLSFTFTFSLITIQTILLHCYLFSLSLSLSPLSAPSFLSVKANHSHLFASSFPFPTFFPWRALLVLCQLNRLPEFIAALKSSSYLFEYQTWSALIQLIEKICQGRQVSGPRLEDTPTKIQRAPNPWQMCNVQFGINLKCAGFDAWVAFVVWCGIGQKLPCFMETETVFWCRLKSSIPTHPLAHRSHGTTTKSSQIQGATLLKGLAEQQKHPQILKTRDD